MALRVCTVSFKSATGISHSVEVEAAGIGLARLKKDGWIEGLGAGTRLEIAVREPSTLHSLTVQQVQRWVDGITDESGGSVAEDEGEGVASVAAGSEGSRPMVAS